MDIWAMDNSIFKKKVIAVNQGKQEKFLIKFEIAYWCYIWTDKLGVQWKRVKQVGCLQCVVCISDQCMKKIQAKG